MPEEAFPIEIHVAQKKKCAVSWTHVKLPKLRAVHIKTDRSVMSKYPLGKFSGRRIQKKKKPK